jgi:hypothetical protein
MKNKRCVLLIKLDDALPLILNDSKGASSKSAPHIT